MFCARSPTSGYRLNLLLATAHVPLASVPGALTGRLLDARLALLLATLPRDLGYSRDRVGGV
jgi:4-hydroxy-L-threonine phosphate dehydrogenase PdxA